MPVSVLATVVVQILQANVGVVVLGETRGAPGIGVQKALGAEKPSGCCSFKTS